MRVLALVAVVSLCACAGARHARAATASETSLAPLQPCEVRQVKIDGAHVIAVANADGTPAALQVLDVPTGASRARIQADATRGFGAVRDEPPVAHPSKWGLTTYTDGCGRSVRPSTR